VSRTLVLGAGGFLGAHVVQAALAREPHDPSAEVVAVARDFARVPGRFLGAARRLALDLEDGALALLEAERPARVVCAAALARIDACERDPRAAQRINAELPGRLAAWCAAHGARFVHVSTDLVFGGRPPRPPGFREDDPPAPLSVYGASKEAGERAVLAEDPAALIVRLPLLYGDSGGRALGASDSLLAAIARGERPQLFTDEWRTPLEVGNAAAALVELAAGGAAGLLHVAGPERCTRFELARAVLAAHGPAGAAAALRAARRADLGQAGQRPEDVSLDCARARAELATELLGVRAGLDRARGRG
jgi:dTDP-4-dehydrorhamnose reductase